MNTPAASHPPTDSVPGGHVQLNLIYEEGESSFYLQIPLDIITSLCLKPRKYLRFLGWCILGIKGDLAVENGGDLERISTEGDLEEEGIYYYRVPNNDFTHAVDLEVIKEKSVPSEAPRTRNNFCERLLERDICCVLTGIKPAYGEGLHIIPHRRGSDWFQLIVDNRPKDGEAEAGLSDINDIRNGMFANLMICSAFDDREIVILKTPNAILSMADIPERHERSSMPEQVGYPARMRYTLQWLVTTGEEQLICPNNRDAAFKKRTKKLKPSPLLLHYNYGAAAVRWWGKGIETFQLQTNPPHPPVPTAAQSGPQTTTHNRNTTIQKLNAARDASGAGPSNSGPGAGTSQTQQAVDSELQWDEDDVMLFFWANSKAARDRHKEKEAEQNQRMEQWRAGVNGVSD